MKRKKTATADSRCPCGSGHDYPQCCARHLDDNIPAPNAEALMRSRYTAYTQGNEAYLLTTWHSSTRPDALNLADDPPCQWLGLQLKRFVPDSQDPQRALVEFVARYKVNGKAYRLHESSRFCQEDEQWLYIDGDIA